MLISKASLLATMAEMHCGLDGGRSTKVTYCGITKNSPSHAQQKRTAKKRKNRATK